MAVTQTPEEGLKVSNAPSDGKFLQYKDSTDKLTWATAADGTMSNLVEDTTPQLGGNLDVQDKVITTDTGTDTHITIKPKGAGQLAVGPGDDEGAISANGTYNLRLKANAAGAAGANINLISGNNGGIDITPVGTGNVQVSQGKFKVAGNATEAHVTAHGTSHLKLNTNEGTDSGEIEIEDGANNDIKITPNGTGDVVIDGLKYPQADGSANQVLKTDGSAQLSWTTITSGGGATGFDFDDNVKIRWGTGNDWSAYFNGSTMIFKNEDVTAGTFQVLPQHGFLDIENDGKLVTKRDWTEGTGNTQEPSGPCARFQGYTNTASSGSGDCNSYIEVGGTNGANGPTAVFGSGRKTEYGHADIGFLTLRGVRQYGSAGTMKWAPSELDSGSVYTYHGSQYQGYEVFNTQSNNQRCFTIHWASGGDGAGNNNYLLHLHDARTTTNSTVKLLYANSESGGNFMVEQDGDVKNSNNSYGSSSDEKLKQDITDASSQWEDIKNIRVRKFKWKAAPEQGYMLGVIAQEVEKVSPGLIKEDPDQIDEVDADGTTVHKFKGTYTKSAKYSILYMKAIKALQEAIARIETLEAKVKTLEGS